MAHVVAYLPNWIGVENAWHQAMVEETPKQVSLEVHCEDWYHALLPYDQWKHQSERIVPATYQLLGLLRHYDVRGTFYILGHVAEHHPKLVKDIASGGHLIGSHGYFHRHSERELDESDLIARLYLSPHRIVGYRAPYWNGTPHPLFSGGASLRVLPYWLLKRNVLRSGMFWVHPHDIDPDQPRIKWTPWRRYINLKNGYSRLACLLSDVRFAQPILSL